MKDNVVEFGGITRLDIPPDRLLQNAIGKLECVVILGFTVDGQEYFKSSQSDGAQVVYHCERAKHRIMKTIDEMGE